MDLNIITRDVIGAAIKIHKELGPGLLESVYEEKLFYELTTNYRCSVERQKAIKIEYGNIKHEKGFRADLVVEGKVLVELKSVEEMHRKFKKVVLTYNKLGKYPIGLLINFNEELLKTGITRLAIIFKSNFTPNKLKISQRTLRLSATKMII